MTDLERVGSVTGFGRAGCDITNFEELDHLITKLHPDIIVNAAAYTQTEKAEAEADRCFAVNAQGPRNLAAAALAHGATLIHYSTDYVFDGKSERAYGETDAPNPLSVYGRSKLAGEDNIIDSGASSLILRIGWLYSDDDQSFLGRIMAQMFKKEELRVVDDQFGAPTSASLVSNLTARILEAGDLNSGGAIVHLACTGKTSWFDFAHEILTLAQEAKLDIRTKRIIPVPSAEFNLIADRPKYSVLDTTKWTNRFAIELPSWQEELGDVFRSYLVTHNLAALA